MVDEMTEGDSVLNGLKVVAQLEMTEDFIDGEAWSAIEGANEGIFETVDKTKIHEFVKAMVMKVIE